METTTTFLIKQVRMRGRVFRPNLSKVHGLFPSKPTTATFSYPRSC